MTHTFTGRVRQILKRLSINGAIPYQAVALELGMVTNRQKQCLYPVMRELVKRGECERIAQGIVRYVANSDPRPAKKTGCMLRLIRANRNETITVADLVANCGVSARNARDYLNQLTKRGNVRRIAMPNNRPSKYQMIKDPGPILIRNDANAKKLRRMRQAKRNCPGQDTPGSQQ